MLPSTMKALVKEQEGPSYQYKDVPVPSPGDGDLLVKVRKVALCGSDINVYKWNDIARILASVPLTPGHEMVGEVVAVGPNVPPEYAIGKRVCVENHFYCGECFQCTHDEKHICQNLNQFGYGRGTIHGGCSEYTIIPARYAYLLKSNITDAQASILEPIGVAHQALEEIDPNGETVLVMGCGPIGLLSVGIAKAMGATKVIASDVVASKLETAQIMGADVVIDSTKENLQDTVMKETNCDGIGCIVDASGAPSAVNNCFTMLRKGGKVVLIGLLKGTLHVENPLQNIVFKSITLKTVHGRKIFHSWEESEKMVFERAISVDPVITHDFPMSRFEEAFHVLMSGEGIKIIMTPDK
ncbi:L-threonine 3-dehydrogenase-like [Dysidea avara]|uniref:L-threonine 3-dehydrogenase-like n=1 Tax=Dysidea avara TaxID=196820 RepID=UPI0033244162